MKDSIVATVWRLQCKLGRRNEDSVECFPPLNCKQMIKHCGQLNTNRSLYSVCIDRVLVLCKQMRILFILIQFEIVSDHLNESKISAIFKVSFESFAFRDLKLLSFLIASVWFFFFAKN